MRTFHLHLPVGDLWREATVRVPDRPSGALAIGFHGGLGNPEQFERQTEFTDAALGLGFTVAYPAGVAGTWNAGSCCGRAKAEGVDEPAFFDALVERIGELVTLDPDRLHLFGFSNGAMEGWDLVAKRAALIASVGLHSGDAPDLEAKPARPVPALYFHGTLDRNLPIAGGRGKLDARCVHHSAVETVRWASQAGAPVTYVKVPGLGHQWCGGQAIPTLGPQLRTPDATERILDFFRSNPRA